MRVVTILIIALFAGLIFGLALVELRLASWPWSGTVGDSPGRYQREGLPAPDPSVGTPRLEIDITEHNFGVMDADAEGSYAFTFKNTGTAALSLATGNTSCKCTVSEIKKEQVEPGESTDVVLRWEPNAYTGPYMQTAMILTNDSKYPQVQLVVKGKISASLVPVPEELKFSNPLPAGKPSTGKVVILDFLDQPMNVESWKFSDRETADFFEATFTPLTEEELDEYSDCKSGVTVEVTVLPGLPRGPFRQSLLISTGVEAEPALVVPVMGTVGDDISVVGKGWNQQKGELRIGRIESSEGLERKVFIITRGVDSNSVVMKLQNVNPDFLKVELGETEPFGASGTVTRTAMTITVPPGIRPCTFMGGLESDPAVIELETGLPDSPKLNILLSFFIEE